MDTIPVTNEIEVYLHCAKCIAEKPDHMSPAEFAQLEIGWTQLGLQVWCRRHQCNVISIDFEGHKVAANTGCT